MLPSPVSSHKEGCSVRPIPEVFTLRGNPVHSSFVEPNFGNSENTKYVL